MKIKIGLAAIALAILSAVGAQAQTVPPPSLAQCRADVLAWSTYHVWDNVSALQIESRVDEMVQCSAVDSTYEAKYYVARDIGMSQQLTRLKNYLNRHPEQLQQFIAEDAAGAR